MNAKADAESLTGQPVVGNFSIQATLPNGKQLTISGYVFEGDTEGTINQRLTMNQSVVDFQRTLAEIPELEIKLDVSIKRLDEIRAHYQVILDKKESGKKLTGPESQALQVMDINVNKHVEDIEAGRKAIADAKLLVGID